MIVASSILETEIRKNYGPSLEKIEQKCLRTNEFFIFVRDMGLSARFVLKLPFSI